MQFISFLYHALLNFISSHEIISLSVIIGIIFIFLSFRCFSFIRRRKFLLKEDNLSSQFLEFANNPKEFNYKEITLYGKVVYVLHNSLYQIIKRKLKNYYCLITHSNDYKNRYIHLRFLISHPKLKEGECILAEYNLSKNGSIRLHKGDVVEVKGEYIHSQDESKHFYGKIHKVHSPNGYIKKVS